MAVQMAVDIKTPSCPRDIQQLLDNEECEIVINKSVLVVLVRRRQERVYVYIRAKGAECYVFRTNNSVEGITSAVKFAQKCS